MKFINLANFNVGWIYWRKEFDRKPGQIPEEPANRIYDGISEVVNGELPEDISDLNYDGISTKFYQ